MGLFSFLSRKLPVDTQKIEQAISRLEKKTSAELRVVVEHRTDNPNAVERANQLLDELNMRETAERNGVLIYLAFKPHRLAVVGDAGIHQKVGQVFWQIIYDAMKADVRRGDYTEGICKGIEQVGKRLAVHFPYRDDDKNELPNEVVIK